MKFPRISLLIILSTVALLSQNAALAQFQKNEDAIKYRQGALRVMGYHFGMLGAMAKSEIPYDAQAALEAATVVQFMAKLPWKGFIDGSQQGETKAKAEIWQNKDKFLSAQQKLQSATDNLLAAARKGDIDSLRAAVGETGSSCKACHDDFRNR